ncbi:MAG: MCE family protein [Chitinophagia bacterium]|nr:MCE family protein [Chitinophagia bacterium]
MKVSNETRVGALAAIAITVLILGFNFLKGRNLMARKDTIYAVFSRTDGLSTSDAIRINGLQVGNVTTMDESDEDVTAVVVGFHLTRDVNIPEDSYAVINANPLGSTSVTIVRGSSKKLIGNGDTIRTVTATGMLDDLKGAVAPVMTNVNGTLKSIDSLVEQVGGTLDPAAKAHLQSMLADLSETSRSLKTLMDTRNGDLAATLRNASSISGNLRKNNDTIGRILSNLNALSSKLASMDLERTLSKVQSAVDNLNIALEQVNKGSGTAGLLLHDPKLYRNLDATANSLNILLQDLRMHPKRYISFSVFGRKEKEQPLMAPLPDSTGKVPLP